MTVKKRAEVRPVCPDCHRKTRRTQSRLVKVGVAYAHGTCATYYGYLCKHCAEQRKQKERHPGVSSGHTSYLRMERAVGQ